MNGNTVKPYDVLVLGELNVDLIFNDLSAKPQLGTEVLAEQMNLTLGSSSAIFAANIASLGLKTAFVGKVGDDLFGAFAIQELTKANVSTKEILLDPKQHTGATVVFNEEDDRANITYLGAMATLELSEIPIDLFDQFRHLHISSFYFQPALKNEFGHIFRIAREKGLTTSFDMQWDPLENWEIDFTQILPYVSIFLPNEKEIMLSTKSADLQEAVDKILGLCEILSVKRGQLGSITYFKDDQITHPCFVNEHLEDAIGAGDSFNAGFVSAFLRGHPIDQCQFLGNLAGSVSTTRAGGTKAFAKQGQFQEIAKSHFDLDLDTLGFKF